MTVAVQSRELIEFFNTQYLRLHARSSALINRTDFELVYRVPVEGAQVQSFGELLLRSAAVVERTFGGITANLWDDPFEWTLPEQISTKNRFSEYLEEVESTRQRAFARFLIDADLFKHVQVPAGLTRPLLTLLTETLANAADYQGRAIATSAIISNARLFD